MRPVRKPASPPIKLLMVVGSVPPEPCGVGDYAYRLSRTLASRGCCVTLLSSGQRETIREGKGWAIRAEMREWCGFRLSRFLRVLDEEKPDVVHLQYPSRGYGWRLLPNLLPLVLRLLRPGLPVVTTLHEYAGLNPLRKASYLFFTVFSRAVTAPDSLVRKGIEGAFPWTRGKTCVIPVGSFLEPSRSKAPGVAGSPILLFPGFLLRKKGPLEAVEALSLLKDAFPRARLVFASDAASHRDVRDEVKARAAALDVADRMVFMDDLDASGMSALMKKADLVVLPFHDGASTRRTTLVSAIRLGCRVVTTEGPGTLEEFKRGGVLLARAKDPRSLAEVVRRGLTDRKARADMASKVGHLARLFDWERIADMHRAVYEGVVKGGSL